MQTCRIDVCSDMLLADVDPELGNRVSRSNSGSIQL